MSDQTIEALGLNNDADPSEPSMEDILASIRRIIADDDEVDTPGDDAASNLTDHTDVRDFAAVSPETADQNTVIVEAEQTDVDAMDLEDILVLSDDDFSAEDLEIPAMEFASEDISDDLLISADEALEAEFDEILNGTDETPVSNPASFEIKATGDELVSAVDLTAADTAPPKYLASEDIAIDLSDDIDLILSDDSDSPFVFQENQASEDSSEILGIVEAGIADIENRAVEAPSDMDANPFIDPAPIPSQSLSAAPVDMVTDTSDSIDLDPPAYDPGDDDVIDLVGDLLAKADAYDDIEESPSELEADISSAGADDPAEIDSLSHDEDMDLLKSLMADLTESSLSDDTETDDGIVDEFIPEASGVSASVTEEEIADPDLLSEEMETDLVNDILNMAMADEISISEEMLNESVVVAEPIKDVPDFTMPDAALSPGETMAAAEVGTTPETAIDEETDEVVSSVDASINSLLSIAALAERDADTVQDDLASRLSEAPEENTLVDDSETGLDEGLVAAQTEDVDVALTPETQSAEDTIDAIFGEPLQSGTESGSSVEAGSAYETILPESEGSLPPADVPPETELAASSLLEDMPLTDSIFDTPIFDDIDDSFEEILPSEDIAIAAEDTASITDAPDVPSEPVLEQDDLTLPTVTTEIPTEQEPTEMPKLVAKDGIIDEITETAASEAFASLNQIVEEKTEYEESGPRIGDLVQAALQPMLKEWLDDNLKGIVERAVTKEVKRISSGK